MHEGPPDEKGTVRLSDHGGADVATLSPAIVGALVVLTTVLLALKLLDRIPWSWWWVLAPLWLPWGMLVVGLAVVLVLGAVQDWWRMQFPRRSRKTTS